MAKEFNDWVLVRLKPDLIRDRLWPDQAAPGETMNEAALRSEMAPAQLRRIQEGVAGALERDTGLQQTYVR